MCSIETSSALLLWAVPQHKLHLAAHEEASEAKTNFN